MHRIRMSPGLFKVSKPGFDVDAASPAQLIIDGSRPAIVHQTGVISIATTTGTFTASWPSLGFRPIVLCQFSPTGDGFAGSPGSGYLGVTQTYNWDDTTVYVASSQGGWARYVVFSLRGN